MVQGTKDKSYICPCPHSEGRSYAHFLVREGVLWYDDENLRKFWLGQQRGQHNATIVTPHELKPGEVFICDVCGGEISGWLVMFSQEKRRNLDEKDQG